MEVIQVEFKVPTWVEMGINEGTLKIFGGVVRNLRGEIVHHLKDATKISEKANGKLKIIAVGVALVAGGAYVAYRMVSKKEKLVRKIDQFNEALQDYINDGINGNLTTDKIIQLQNTCYGLLDTLNNIDVDKIKVDMSEEAKLDDVINSIKKYTEELNKANRANKVIVERNKDKSIKDNIIDLNKYLNVQKEIYAQHINY